jgi:hypothetical protein
MIKTEMELREVTVDTKIVCDRCGAEEYLNDYGQEYLRWKNNVGYFGREFEDLTTLELDLCEKCVKELLGPYIRIDEYRLV